MPLIVKENSPPDIPPVEEGVYVAICYGVIDLGTQLSPIFGIEQHKILIQWEIPELRGDFERNGVRQNLPRAISKRYTLSLSPKANLRRDLEAWRGRKFTAEELAGFDLKNILGTACQLQIVHIQSKDGSGRIWASVNGIMAVARGMPKPKLENPPQWFSFQEADPTLEIPRGLPEWVQKIIAESKEWKITHGILPPAAAADVQSPGIADVIMRVAAEEEIGSQTPEAIVDADFDSAVPADDSVLPMLHPDSPQKILADWVIKVGGSFDLLMGVSKLAQLRISPDCGSFDELSDECARGALTKKSLLLGLFREAKERAKR